MADGRKSHKNLVNKANTKLKNELSSIKVRPAISAAADALGCSWCRLCSALPHRSFPALVSEWLLADNVGKHMSASSRPAGLNTSMSWSQDILDKKGTSYGRAFDREEAASSGGGAPSKRKRVI